MYKNEQGFIAGQEIKIGDFSWTVIDTGENWIECIANDCVLYGAFDDSDKETVNFAKSTLCEWLNGEFFNTVLKSGAPEEMFQPIRIDLTADDGLNKFGSVCKRIGLLTNEKYRRSREYIREATQP